MILVCPTCGYPVTQPAALKVIIDRVGIHADRATCQVCHTVFTVAVRTLQESPLSVEQLKKAMNQYRG
jgi:transcriptional regulator NrdR family protein